MKSINRFFKCGMSIRTGGGFPWGSHLFALVGVVFVLSSFAAASAGAGEGQKHAKKTAAALFSAPGVDRERLIDTLTRTFDDVVFGSELSPKTRSKVIAKWQGPIGIEIQGRVTKRHAQFLETHLRTLADLTGLRFHQLKKNKATSEIGMQKISFVFVRRAEMGAIKIPGVDPLIIKRLALEGGCYFLSFKKPPERIVLSIVVVNVERNIRNLNACLLEELVQSLGLPNDTNIMRPSVFSDRNRLTKLSPSDRALVLALYDPRMKAGLARDKAVSLAQALFRKMATGGR